MPCYEVIDSLNTDQIDYIHKNLKPPKTNFSVKKEDVKLYLRQFASNVLEQSLAKTTAFDVINAWGQCMIPVLKKKKVSKEFEDERKGIIQRISTLKLSVLNTDEILETLCRDILLFLFKSLSNKEKKGFVQTIKKDLQNLKIELTSKEIESIIGSNLTFVGIGISGLIVPIVANTLLQRLTQGIAAWFLINILGQRAAQVAFLGALSGPVGWGVAGTLTALTSGFALMSFRRQQKKIRFIQAVFSVYCYSYQNRLNARNI